MIDVQYHISKFRSLQRDRSNFDSQWQEAARRLLPADRSTFFDEGLSTGIAQGRKETQDMFDATGALALSKFASVIESLVTPQASQWHRLVPTDPDLLKVRQVREYMDTVNSLLFRYRYAAKAGFVGQIQKLWRSYGCYGNGVFFIDEMDTDEGFRYKTLPLGGAYLEENHQGVPVSCYRSFRLTARQMFKQFGPACPDEIMAKYNSPDEVSRTYEILHCVWENDRYMPGNSGVEGMKFLSVYIYRQGEKPLSLGGYHSFPFAFARAARSGEETYGRGPAQLVLPSIKVLNEQKKTMLRQGHRIVDPVLLAFDDGAISTISLRPGAVNYGGVSADGRPLIHALPTGNLAVGHDLMELERLSINDAFLITLFQILVDAPQMTATEVLERAREKGMLIAPTAGAIQAEVLSTLVERELDIASRQGILPPYPAAFVGAELSYEIEYDSPISRMARAENAAGFMRSLQTAVDFFTATQDPAPLDWFDFDQAMPAIQDINGSPVAWTRTKDAVLEIRKQRAQQAQQRQLLEAAPALAGAAKALPMQGTAA